MVLIRWAVVVATMTFLSLAALSIAIRPGDKPIWLSILASGVLSWLLYVILTRKARRRIEILAEPFPGEWEAVLQRDVVFFRVLDDGEKGRFRRDLKLFLGEKRVTGIGMELDTTTRVLAAASAVIPIFGFPDWEWDQIEEILIYPSRFSQDFQFGEIRDHHTLGMVGTGAMNRLMILSKPDLIQGFRNPGDKKNVGLHEFAHLVDKSDGAIDGLPEVGLDKQAIGPWVDLVRRKMEEIRQGDSDIDPYALTNEAEFFSVATEYFFERPGVMENKHPELFAMLQKVFRQDLRSKAAAMVQLIRGGRRRFGRNSPCPCGSGAKYKKCCLKKGRAS